MKTQRRAAGSDRLFYQETEGNYVEMTEGWTLTTQGGTAAAQTLAEAKEPKG